RGGGRTDPGARTGRRLRPARRRQHDMDRPRDTAEGLRHRLMPMDISFLDRWRKRYGEVRGAAVPESLAEDPEGVAELLSECELLRARAEAEGVELDDTSVSLERLDQLVPRW